MAVSQPSCGGTHTNAPSPHPQATGRRCASCCPTRAGGWTSTSEGHLGCGVCDGSLLGTGGALHGLGCSLVGPWAHLCQVGTSCSLPRLASHCLLPSAHTRFDGYRFDGVTSMMYHHHGLQTTFTGGCCCKRRHAWYQRPRCVCWWAAGQRSSRAAGQQGIVPPRPTPLSPPCLLKFLDPQATTTSTSAWPPTWRPWSTSCSSTVSA